MLRLLVISGLLALAQSSAIPMWEFLSKQEKMSYLYSMFANQVDEFCEVNHIKDCNNQLLKYGLGKLKEMPEDHLDTMDPYQRGANTIIWDSMMQGHEMMKTPPRIKTSPTTTTKPNSYEDDTSFGEESEDYGSQTAASARIDNVYRLPPPKGFVYTIASGHPQYTYPSPQHYQQYLGNHNNRPTNQQYLGNYQQQQHGSNSYGNHNNNNNNGRLTDGPMVFKVYPDGRPVREPSKPLPQDDDLKQYKMSKVQLPNF